MNKSYAYLINILWSDEDGLYIAEVPELEGCLTHGKTPQGAAKNAQNAIESWIRTAKSLKHPIPEPVSKRRISGKFNVRLPKQLHRFLVLRAAREGVSLNQLLTSLVAHAI